MIVREAALAGSWYEADSTACRQHVEQLFAEASAALDGPRPAGVEPLPERIVGGIVPHAGWDFSGEVAARTLEAIARSRTPAVLVVFGAVHRFAARGPHGLLFDRGVWETPLGRIDVDERLAQRVLDTTNLVLADVQAHGHRENSVEIQMPLIRHRFPEAKVLPILVPPSDQSHEVGLAVGRTLEVYSVDAVVLGSTDLTHYGPGYGFMPAGVGPKALRWARDVNDRAVIDAVVSLAAEDVVARAESNQSACGPGAVAATLAAARKLGATRGVVLEHVTSAEVMARVGRSADDAVGYLSAVLG